ncbi:unnamed protein product [Lactuca saligna]|uniref:Uncharacterized protein n=1 Tax=Lactuca saligna TaxID=75948 RepID=A0AA35ZZ66_LACSI|nr:unnamed protein product [Lactuca saligna]
MFPPPSHLTCVSSSPPFVQTTATPSQRIRIRVNTMKLSDVQGLLFSLLGFDFPSIRKHRFTDYCSREPFSKLLLRFLRLICACVVGCEDGRGWKDDVLTDRNQTPMTLMISAEGMNRMQLVKSPISRLLGLGLHWA